MLKGRLNSENVCYYSAKNLLSACLLSKNIKIEIYRTIVLPVILHRCETLSYILKEEHRLRMFKKGVLRKYLGLGGTQ
jgi:hypothetical protein